MAPRSSTHSPTASCGPSVFHIFMSVVEQPIRTAVYGPVRTVVWEGSGREACPYPDSTPTGS